MRRTLVGDRTQPAAFRHLADGRQGFDSRIGFRFLDGQMRGLSYSRLIETEFDPASGVVLHFVGHKVILLGRNLADLYFGIEDGTVGEVVEQHVNAMACPEDAPYIDRILWEQA